jgi:exopolyphosphatase/guanosine-5'-triphosphate,3'-diphosphate pyrophosphatase
MRVAIIDLGTNTFNLLIADTYEKESWTQVLKIKEGVKLGQGGINKGYILAEAFERGIAAMVRHYERIKAYNVEKVYAFGTSALRDAANGHEFISEVKQRFGFEITLISGEKEAELIYKGVKQTVGNINETFLILDIGGGSNEFIIAGQHQFYWKESFRLGMARLMDKFLPPDPITPELIKELEHYFEQELSSLFVAVDKYKPEILVGASGSFDSLVNMYYADIYANEEVLPASQKLDLEIFRQMHDKLIHSVRAEREKMKGLEPVRRDMIVLAVVFVNYILKRLKIQELYQSSYSLKEGAMWEVMQNM